MGGLRAVLLGFAWLGLSGSVTRADVPPLITVGTQHTISDVGLFVADKRGYFRAEGLDVRLVPYSSQARMIAPLATGQLAAGSVEVTPRLLAAITAPGHDIRIVADKGSTQAGVSFESLIVRSDLVANGTVKAVKDLKGLRIAATARQLVNSVTLLKALARGGLKMADIAYVSLPASRHAIALANRSVDAALTPEPWASKAERQRAGVRMIGDAQINPNRQTGVLLYSGAFAAANPKAAVSFMKAYLRGVRNYNDALKDLQLKGQAAPGIIAILQEYTDDATPDVLRAMVAPALHPDGRLALAGLAADVAHYMKTGALKGAIKIGALVDPTFAERATKSLGSYRRPK